MIFSFFLFATFLSSLSFIAFSSPHRSPLPAFLAYVSAHLLLYFIVFRNPSLGIKNTASGHSKKSSLFKPILSTPGILFFSIAFRLLFLVYPQSDDVNRYAWEGMIQNHGFNPYLQSPEDLQDFAGSDPVFEGINHQDHPAIYPPLSLLIFRGLAAISYKPSNSPEKIFAPFKYFFIGCDLLTLLLLTQLLILWKKPSQWLALYGWNPFILVYGIGEAHLEMLQNLFLVLVLLNYASRKNSFRWGFFFLGCAVMSKYLAIVFVPFLITRKNNKGLIFFFLPLICYLPFWNPQIFDGLISFSSQFHYNEFFPKIFWVVSGNPINPYVLCSFLGMGFFWIWLLWKDAPIFSMRMAWIWLLLWLPTLHPWYLIPILFFLLHQPSRAWFVLTATMALNHWAYNYQLHYGEWKELPWLWFGVYMPFLVVLFRDLGKIHFPWNRLQDIPKSLDIIVPTFNEEERINNFLDQLQKSIQFLKESRQNCHYPRVQVFLVDGGSTDNTLQIANKFDFKILKSSKASRGQQFATGIQEGSGALVLMIHADALIQENTLEMLFSKFDQTPSMTWGILGHFYASKNLKMRIIELSNRLRFLIGGVAFGDQGIFVRRKVLDKVGGMPCHRLMEDVELSLRLAPYPNRLNLGGMLTVSTRRWDQKKFTGYTFQVFKLVSTYLFYRRLGFNTESLANKMYNLYYNRK